LSKDAVATTDHLGQIVLTILVSSPPNYLSFYSDDLLYLKFGDRLFLPLPQPLDAPNHIRSNGNQNMDFTVLKKDVYQLYQFIFGMKTKLEA
jgi:hypothetical protein